MEGRPRSSAAAWSRERAPWREKIRVVPIGVDLGAFLEPSREALDHAAALRRGHGSPLWLCVARLVYYKGLRNAIDALALVPGRLLIAGSGPIEGELRERARRGGVADRVVWLGAPSDAEIVGAYHAATTGFELGKASFIDVLDAQRTLFQVQAQYLGAYTEAQHAAADIERIVGTDHLLTPIEPQEKQK